MDASLVFFGIIGLFSALIKAAVILVLVLLIINVAKGGSGTKKYQYGKHTYPSKNEKSFSDDKTKRKSIFSRNKDVDCDLDERIFGPKNQHKDLF